MARRPLPPLASGFGCLLPEGVIREGAHTRQQVARRHPAFAGDLQFVDDDAAVGGDPAEVYGKLGDMGATMIQTDRPELLISYLRSRGLHN